MFSMKALLDHQLRDPGRDVRLNNTHHRETVIQEAKRTTDANEDLNSFPRSSLHSGTDLPENKRKADLEHATIQRVCLEFDEKISEVSQGCGRNNSELRLILDRNHGCICDIQEQQSFWKVFMQCATCAHGQCSKVKILHHDISANNLAYHVGEGPTLADVVLDLRYYHPSYLVCSDGIDFTYNFEPLANLLMLFATNPLTEKGGLGFNIKTGYVNPFDTHNDQTLSMSFRVNVLDPTNKWKEVRVQKGELIQSAYSLLGRETAVYRVTFDVDKDPRTLKVVKTSRRIVDRKKEHEIILHAGRIDFKHVIEILGYGVEVDDSPTATLINRCTTNSEIKEIKELRILIEREYKPIHTITDQKIFLNVFMQCVICAHDLYSRCDILHGDISINNLAYYINDENKYIGVLMDFDLASKGSSEPSSHVRSGTAPFMARDLLDPSKESYTHEFHHDLESFLYVLIWYTLGYTGKTIGKGDPLIKFRRGSSRDMFDAKDAYFSRGWKEFFPRGYNVKTDPLRFTCYSLSLYYSAVAVDQSKAALQADWEYLVGTDPEVGPECIQSSRPVDPMFPKVTFGEWLRHANWGRSGPVPVCDKDCCTA